MSLKNRFSNQDLERIKAAVRESESKISGEIVPVFVERSGHYIIANYRGAVILASLVFALIVLVDRYYPPLAVYDPLVIFVLVALAGVFGGVIAHYVNPAKRMLLSQFHMDQSTKKKAESAFLEEEVFNTRHRTGIMLFVSFFEHEVIVMADRGISKVVDQKEWDRMVTKLTDQIKRGKLADGMVEAIQRCGAILLEKGFQKTNDDVNELRDDLRLED
ncbi:MAG: TPM domain-containing protein [Cyclobacteriaceae bacterium]